MTQTLIKEQIKTIKEATKKAAQSSESARKFLKDAGILKTSKSANPRTSTVTKKK